MVDNFQKKYAALQIPYPSDNGAIKAIEDQAAEQKAAYNQFVAESNKAIEALKAEMSTFEAMKPVEEMNIEEALDAGLIGNQITGVPNPDVPSFWPHDEVIAIFIKVFKVINITKVVGLRHKFICVKSQAKWIAYFYIVRKDL